jgi:hypothetical protein
MAGVVGWRLPLQDGQGARAFFSWAPSASRLISLYQCHWQVDMTRRRACVRAVALCASLEPARRFRVVSDYRRALAARRRLFARPAPVCFRLKDERRTVALLALVYI